MRWHSAGLGATGQSPHSCGAARGRWGPLTRQPPAPEADLRGNPDLRKCFLQTKNSSSQPDLEQGKTGENPSVPCGRKPKKNPTDARVSGAAAASRLLPAARVLVPLCFSSSSQLCNSSERVITSIIREKTRQLFSGRPEGCASRQENHWVWRGQRGDATAWPLGHTG